MYVGSFVNSFWLSNTVAGTKIRDRLTLRAVPSGATTVYSPTMGVKGFAAVINLSFTQPWPRPPGFVVARIYTRVPAPPGRLRDII